MRFLVTGGAGFIGSALTRSLNLEPRHHICVLDSLTYAGDLATIAGVFEGSRHRFVHGDVADADTVRSVYEQTRPDIVFHLAAESHVDRSIDGPNAFVHSNVVGTFVMLEEALRHWRTLDSPARDRFRFVHVSTDEVFGGLESEGSFTEDSRYAPGSPYAATKAAADHLVRAWHRTYGLPTVVTNCSNNFGPFQHPEKLIPLTIMRALSGLTLPVYGSGKQVRDWLYVEDHVDALQCVANAGRAGETYLIGAQNAWRNIDVVTALCTLLDEARPRDDGTRHATLIEHVADRPGHDFRYAIDGSKLRQQLGWQAACAMSDGLRRTVRWYLDNEAWARSKLRGPFQGERLGLGGRD